MQEDTGLRCSSSLFIIIFLIEDAVGIYHPQDTLFWLLFLLLWCHLKLPACWRPTIHSTFSLVNLPGIPGSTHQGRFLGISARWVVFPQKLWTAFLAVQGRRFSTTILSKFSWLAWYRSEHEYYLRHCCHTLFNKVHILHWQRWWSTGVSEFSLIPQSTLSIIFMIFCSF